jgi:hypothetical protein
VSVIKKIVPGTAAKRENKMAFLKKMIVAAAVISSLAFVPANAGQVKALGMVLESEGAHIGSSPVSAGASLFLGDILSTDSDGRIKVRVGQTTYELLGDSIAAFYPGKDGAIAELRRGSILVANNSTTESFEIYASDVRVVPGQNRPVLGEVSIKSTCELVVSTTTGLLDVTAGAEKRSVKQSHSYRVVPEHSVDGLKDATISPEDENYHRHHNHVGCAAPVAQRGMKPPFVTGEGHFLEVAFVAVGVITAIPIYKALESPDRP